jgi:hypothetical protein
MCLSIKPEPGTKTMDFREFPIHTKIERFGNIAHVIQTYGAEYSEGKQRGINSIQLAYQKGRWWIVNLLWDSETPENQIPAEYLK